jgi:hypothetical protein
MTPMLIGLLPVLKELWSANMATIADPALKALALKAMAAKMVALASTAYGVQYMANSDWVRLMALHTNAPINTIDALAYLESLPVIGILPFESARTLLVNYWFMT